MLAAANKPGDGAAQYCERSQLWRTGALHPTPARARLAGIEEGYQDTVYRTGKAPDDDEEQAAQGRVSPAARGPEQQGGASGKRRAYGNAEPRIHSTPGGGKRPARSRAGKKKVGRL